MMLQKVHTFHWKKKKKKSRKEYSKKSLLKCYWQRRYQKTATRGTETEAGPCQPAWAVLVSPYELGNNSEPSHSVQVILWSPQICLLLLLELGNTLLLFIGFSDALTCLGLCLVLQQVCCECTAHCPNLLPLSSFSQCHWWLRVAELKSARLSKEGTGRVCLSCWAFSLLQLWQSY